MSGRGMDGVEAIVLLLMIGSMIVFVVGLFSGHPEASAIVIFAWLHAIKD